MRKIPVLILAVSVFTSLALAQSNDPPRQIWRKDARLLNNRPRTDNFTDFTWIGDQNGDGCDELLICQEPLTRGVGQVDPLNRVELYFGNRERIADEPDFVFEARDSLESMGLAVTYLGALTARGAHDFAIWTAVYRPNQEGGDQRDYYEVNIYRGGEDRFDTEVDFVIRRMMRPGNRPRYGGIYMQNIDKPSDINGDGFDDLLVREQDFEGAVLFDIFYGGADFDTIPDFMLPNVNGEISIGNFNNDAYDDLIIDSYWNPGFTDFFLGGAPPSNEPVLTIPNDYYEGYGINDIHACPDVNNDGYDDWVLSYASGNDPYDRGSWLFFGGDTLDAEPDRSLEIVPVPIGPGTNYGGNVNGDRYGDIISLRIDTRYFFGSSWVDTIPGVVFSAEPDWMIFEKTQGAFGDFNGDGVNDCVFRINEKTFIEIYAGNPDWVVSVDDEGPFPIPKEFSAIAYPNPFNNMTLVTFQLPARGELTAHLYNINGQEVRSFNQNIAAPGAQSLVITGDKLPSGIYYLSAKLNSSTGLSVINLKLIHIN